MRSHSCITRLLCLPAVVRLAFLASTPFAFGADDLPLWFQEGARQGFEAAAATGDPNLIHHFGGTVVGGRVFAPGVDVMATLEAEYAEAMQRLNGGGAGGGVPWWLRGRQSGSGVALSYRPDAPSFFEDKRKVANTELTTLVKSIVARSAKPAVQERASESVEVNDYLPGIACLLRESSAVQQAVPAAKPSTFDQGFVSLAAWTKSSGYSVKESLCVFGFIEPADCSRYRFVDEQGAELKIDDCRAFLASAREAVVDGEDVASQDAVNITLSSELASGFQKVLSRFLKEVRVVCDQRKSADAVSTNPTAAYRWIFGQLIDPNITAYVPFAQVCPSAPRIRIAVCGEGKLDGDEKLIKAMRLLVTTTPLASQASFIAENKGVPAVLIDNEGLHDTAFIECPLFCKDKDKWLRERPALKRVSSEPDAYVRSLLVASTEDIEKMHTQLRDEIQSASSTALETSLSKASVECGLKAAGVDKRKLDVNARVFTNGVGRKIVDGIVALASGQTVPGEAIRGLAGDRSRFSKLADEPQVTAFVDKDLIDSFLVLAIDQEGVSLCDFRAMLGVHQQYATMSSGKTGNDRLETACRFAEIATWLQAVGAGEPVPFNPPFRKLPAMVEAKQKLLAELQAKGDDKAEPASKSEAEAVEPEATKDSNFDFPGT
jgi:hypothetical protein